MSARRNQGYPRRRSIAGRVVSWLARIILVLLLFVGLLLVTVFSFEQYSLQPLAEFLVKKTTGRVLTIDGEIDARAGRIVSLRVDGIRLANADWGSDDSMLSIDEAEISADLFAVLGGRLAIDTLVVNNARMLVEEDEQGLSNWAMGSDEGDADNEGDEQPATAS